MVRKAVTAKACADDVKQFCADTQPGEGHIEACMKTHIADVSDACKVALANAAAGFFYADLGGAGAPTCDGAIGGEHVLTSECLDLTRLFGKKRGYAKCYKLVFNCCLYGIRLFCCKGSGGTQGFERDQ